MTPEQIIANSIEALKSVSKECQDADMPSLMLFINTITSNLQVALDELEEE